MLNYNVKLAQRGKDNYLYTSMKILERQLKSLQEEFDKRVQDVMVQLNKIKDLCDLCGLGLPLQLQEIMQCRFDEINDQVSKHAASMQQISQLKQVYLGLEQQTQSMFDEAKSNKDALVELLGTLGRTDLSVYTNNVS